MYFSEVIKLRAVVKTIDSSGYHVSANTDTTVFANRKSVTRAEFYAAQASKINITQVFEVHAEDWGSQTQVVDGTKVYDIVRAYQKGEGIVELNCSDAAV